MSLIANVVLFFSMEISMLPQTELYFFSCCAVKLLTVIYNRRLHERFLTGIQYWDTSHPLELPLGFSKLAFELIQKHRYK